MRRTRRFLLISLTLAFAVANVANAAPAYPSYQCAGDKLLAAAKRCDKVLKAWAKETKNGKPAQSMIDKADEKFEKAWTKAEEKAAKGNVDCAEMTLSSADMETMMDGAITDIVAIVQAGLDLGVKQEAGCGAKLLGSVAGMCRGILHAESQYIEKMSRDGEGARLADRQARVSEHFDRQWDRVMRKSCPTTATNPGLEDEVNALRRDVVTNTIVSPNVPDDSFMAITHPAGSEAGNPVSYEGDTLVPQCQNGSAYTFFAKRGSVNKLLVYYHGGGACWDSLTCSGLPSLDLDPTCTQTVDPIPPSLSAYGGFADITDPDNPFKDWNVIQVPYCTCDIHVGDKAVDYPPLGGTSEKHVEHRGYDNAKLAEKFARDHFLAPTDIFITGSSAGSYGAIVHGAHLSAVYPTSNISVLGDGGNGVVTQDFMDVNFNNWGALENLPDIPGIQGVPSSQISIPLIVEAAASHYPDVKWGHYTTAFDGGQGGQTGFYHVMLNPNVLTWPQWWNSSCAFNEVMRQQAMDTADAIALENDNYRYYIASGSTHTGFGNPRVYDDTTGGVPPLVDWVNDMIEGDPGWVNVEASPDNVLFPGTCSAGSSNPGASCNLDSDCTGGGTCEGDDVKPDPLQAPFTLTGTPPDEQVVVVCP